MLKRKRAMRIRFNELLRQHKLTPYKLATRSRGRISASTAYRLARTNGRVDAISLDVLAALCEAFKIDCRELFEL